MISLKNLGREIEKINELDPNNLCNICAGPLDMRIERVKLECGHEYHYICMEKWYKHSRARDCPYCRKPNVFQPKPKEKKPTTISTNGCKATTKFGKKCKLKLGKNGSDFCHIHAKIM